MNLSKSVIFNKKLLIKPKTTEICHHAIWLAANNLPYSVQKTQSPPLCFSFNLRCVISKIFLCVTKNIYCLITKVVLLPVVYWTIMVKHPYFTIVQKKTMTFTSFAMVLPRKTWNNDEANKKPCSR